MRFVIPGVLGIVASVMVFWVVLNLAIDQHYFGVFDPHGDLVVQAIQWLTALSVVFLAARWAPASFAAAFAAAFAIGPILAMAAYAIVDGGHPGIRWEDVRFAASWALPALAGYLLSRLP